MKTCLLFILLSGAWTWEGIGDDFRIARFDVQRVFDEYQHSKDATRDAQIRMNTSIRPSSEEWSFLEMRMSYDKLVEGVKDIQAKLDVLKPEDPKRSDLEKQLNAALLATTRAQLEIFEYREKREKKSLDESKKLRAQILREIMEGVKQLGADRGFHVIFPEKLPEENAPLWVFPTDRAEDVTDALLKLLNERYAAKQTRGAK